MLIYLDGLTRRRVRWIDCHLLSVKCFKFVVVFVFVPLLFVSIPLKIFGCPPLVALLMGGFLSITLSLWVVRNGCRSLRLVRKVLAANDEIVNRNCVSDSVSVPAKDGVCHCVNCGYIVNINKKQSICSECGECPVLDINTKNKICKSISWANKII